MFQTNTRIRVLPGRGCKVGDHWFTRFINPKWFLIYWSWPTMWASWLVGSVQHKQQPLYNINLSHTIFLNNIRFTQVWSSFMWYTG